MVADLPDAPLLLELAVVGRCRGNGCPAQHPRSCPVGRTGFGSPCPWPVAVTDNRPRVARCGLVGSSHDVTLWSRACHTFPSPRLVALGRVWRSRWPRPRIGDVLKGILPPRTYVGVELVSPDPSAVVRQFRLHPLPTYKNGRGSAPAELFGGGVLHSPWTPRGVYPVNSHRAGRQQA